MSLNKVDSGAPGSENPVVGLRQRLKSLLSRNAGNDRMQQLAWSERARRAMSLLMLGTALAQPALQGCRDKDRPVDTGVQLPEIEDPVDDDEDAAVTRPPSSNLDDEVNILDLPPNTGMGATLRSITQAMQINPTGDGIPVVFFNTSNGWKRCAQVTMPSNHAGDQSWWDQARRQLDPEQCGTVDVRAQLPLGMPWRAEHMFSAIRHNARQPMHAGERINRRTQIRRAFLEAARHTELYQYLNNYSPDLAEQFVNLVCDGMPALETEYGHYIETSSTGAEGIWQIEPQTRRDAHRYNPRAWGEIFGSRVPNRNSIADESRVVALIFNNIFRHYKSVWPDSHPVFQHPEALLIPALIGGYNPGQGAVQRMITEELTDPAVQAILASNDPERIQNEAYITASTNYFLRHPRSDYGTASLGYYPKVLAYHALFEHDIPGEDNEVVANETDTPTLAEARTQARSFLDNLHQRNVRNIARVRNTSFNLDAVAIPRNAEAWRFVTSAPSQNNVNVYPWLLQHDPFAERYRNGFATNVALERTIEREVTAGNLVGENAVTHPELIFDPDNIAESWRRVARADHIPTINKLITELNARMYANGLGHDYLVIPIINSTVRSHADNGRLRGHSNHSAHPMFAAVDFSCRQYAVIHRKADGSYERFVTDANIGMFFRGLVQASARLAQPVRDRDAGTVQQGDIFVRFHGPPKHFHMVIRSHGPEEQHVNHAPTTPRRPPTANNRPQHPTASSVSRPRLPNVRLRPPLRRPNLRTAPNRTGLRPLPSRTRQHPEVHTNRTPTRRTPILHRRVINRRGRRR